jgi:hypothetical protein
VRRWMLYRCDLGTGELGLGGERGGERGGGVLDCFLVNLSSFFFCKRCWNLRHKDTCRHLDGTWCEHDVTEHDVRYVESFIGLLCIIVLTWHFSPVLSIFYSDTKIIINIFTGPGSFRKVLMGDWTGPVSFLKDLMGDR